MSKSITKRMSRDLDDAIEDVARQLRKAGESVSEEAKENFAEAASVLRRTAERVADEARRETRHLTRAAVKQVKRHPLEAAAIAAGAAVLVGLLLMRNLQPSD